jgi:hypothetical protein
MAISRTWLVARPRGSGGRIATAGRTRERRDPRRSPGRRTRFEAERRRSAGAPIPGTSSEARSEVTETTRDRKARASGGQAPAVEGRQWEAARTRTLVGAVRPDACRGRPGRRAREVRTATNTTSLEGNMSLLASLCEEDGYRSRATSREGRGGAGTPRPTARPARGEPCGRGWGVPGTLLHVRSPTADTRSPPESRPRPLARNPGVVPARLIVTAPTRGPMPEHMSLNLMGSLPITIAGPTPPRDAHSQASLASQHSPLPWPRPRTVGPARRAETARAVRESFRESLWGSVSGSFVSEWVGIERLATSAGVKTRSVETPTHVQKCTFITSDAPITMSED